MSRQQALDDMSKASKSATFASNTTYDGIEVEHSEDSPSRNHSSGTRTDPTREGEDEDDGDDDSNLQKFAKANGLGHKNSILRKASSLLRSGRIPADLSDDEVTALRDETAHKWRQPRLLYFTIMVCSLGAIEQGWAQTAMNGANLYFPDMLGIGSGSTRDTVVVGLINSAIYFSVGLWGAWLSDPVNNRLGRRGAIFVGNVLCLVGNLGCAISPSWQVLLFFRLVLGTGLGINASTVSVFAAECAPPAIRGGLAVSWQMFTAFGIFLGFVANVAFYNSGPNTWRWQLGAPFVPSVPLLAMIYMCPESPAWYMKTRRYGLAYQSLSRLRNIEIMAAKEVYANHLQKEARTNSHLPASSYLSRITDLFTVPRIRHATFASYTVMLSQQLCGINIIAFYSSTIFSRAGFSTFQALLASCIFGFVNFIGAFPAIWTMDSLGRRSLLLWTLPVMAVTLIFTGLSFKLPKGNVQFGLLATLIYLFCAVYSPGMGPVPSAYSAEVFPVTHREVGMSLAVATANFWAAILSLTFPGLLASAGSEAAFELYAMLNVLALMLVFSFVRETKQKSLDELDEVFTPGPWEFISSRISDDMSWTGQIFGLVNRSRVSGSKSRVRDIEYSALGQEEDEEERTRN